MFTASRLLGALLIAFGAYLIFHSIHLLNFQVEVLSTNLHRPLPDHLRMVGGIASLMFALLSVGSGLRFILRPVRLDDRV